LKKILIIFEKNKKVGNGHYVRSKRLHNFLKLHYQSKIINNRDFNKIGYLNYNILIFDLSNYRSSLIKNLKKKISQKIITFENFDNNFADLNISIFEHNINLKDKKNRYTGLKYYFVDNLQIKKRKKYSKIFVSIGSSLNTNKVNIIKKIIKNNQNFNFILAPNFKNKIKQKKLKNLTICKQKNYFKSLQRSYSCITNAGNSLLEAIYFNKPCFVLPQTEKETIFAKYLMKKKLIVDINNFNKIKNNLLVNNIKKNTLNKIDDKGSIRFLKLLKNL